jgi:hypothetical protein
MWGAADCMQRTKETRAGATPPSKSIFRGIRAKMGAPGGSPGGGGGSQV